MRVVSIGPVMAAAALGVAMLLGVQSARGQGTGVTRVVLVPGAGETGGHWQAAVNSLQPSFPGVSFLNVDIIQDRSLAAQADELLPYMFDNHSILVGHSNGGLLARHARAHVGAGATGVITVGTPHAGVPLLLHAGWITDEIALLTFETFETLDLLVLDAWTPLASAYFQIPYIAANIYTAIRVADGVNDYLDHFAPFLADDTPGSSFLTGLPAAGPNSFALNVTLGLGARGGPLALLLSASEAEDVGLTLQTAGYLLDFYVAQAYAEIDPFSLDGAIAAVELASAEDIAITAIELESLWCAEVSYPYQCLAHDGFVPVLSQQYPGATNSQLTGPAHTFETNHSGVIEYLRTTLQQIP